MPVVTFPLQVRSGGKGRWAVIPPQAVSVCSPRAFCDCVTFYESPPGRGRWGCGHPGKGGGGGSGFGVVPALMHPFTPHLPPAELRSPAFPWRPCDRLPPRSPGSFGCGSCPGGAPPAPRQGGPWTAAPVLPLLGPVGEDRGELCVDISRGGGRRSLLAAGPEVRAGAAALGTRAGRCASIPPGLDRRQARFSDRKSTRLNSSH